MSYLAVYTYIHTQKAIDFPESIRELFIVIFIILRMIKIFAIIGQE